VSKEKAEKAAPTSYKLKSVTSAIKKSFGRVVISYALKRSAQRVIVIVREICIRYSDDNSADVDDSSVPPQKEREKDKRR
jgi:hypothetical protein